MERKSMFLAILLALIIPGVGLIYVGQTGWGIFCLATAGASWLMMMTGLLFIFGLPLAIFVACVSVWGTFFAVRAYNRKLA